MKKDHMGIDQYGETYHALGKNPRKALLERLGKTHANKMYRDDAKGNARHVGYVIGRLWITLYQVTSFVQERK